MEKKRLMVLCSAKTLANATDGTHSIRPSSEEVGKTLNYPHYVMSVRFDESYQ